MCLRPDIPSRAALNFPRVPRAAAPGVTEAMNPLAGPVLQNILPRDSTRKRSGRVRPVAHLDAGFGAGTIGPGTPASGAVRLQSAAGRQRADRRLRLLLL